jgi:hypothetical protein
MHRPSTSSSRAPSLFQAVAVARIAGKGDIFDAIMGNYQPGVLWSQPRIAAASAAALVRAHIIADPESIHKKFYS